MLKSLALGLLVAVCTAQSLPSVVQLPDDVRPVHYRVHLRIDPAQPVFTGEMEIDIAVARATRTVWLNGKDLEVSAAGAEVAAEANEFLKLTFPKPLPPGPARLSLRYRGKLRSDVTAGAFRRESTDGDWYVYTTSTAIDARRIFPCFDEPRYKTPWDVTLSAPLGTVALANTAPVSQTTAGKMVTTRFAETRPLPSELVAFAVGPFALRDGGRAGLRRTPMRVAAPRGLATEAGLAAELARTILPRLEEYTGESYGYGKLDHMALLGGTFGGVENPGLIQYLGRLLLVSPGQEPSRREDLEGLMAHEMAHQWFGDMVTQAEWRDVWLSEGITTWLGQKTADLSLPADRRGLRMAASREGAKRGDARPDARPVRLVLTTRDEMRKVYAGVVYAKGASFLSMLEGWLGEKAVQRSLRRYIQEHRHANATTADLVDAVRLETGTNIEPMVESLLDREGVPAVSAELHCEGGRPRLSLRQQRYAPAGSEIPDFSPWSLPVCARTVDGTDCTVLSAASGELELKSAKSCPTWVMPNAGGSGYYRLNLTAEGLKTLVAVRDLTEVERLTLVDEMLAMVQSGSLQAAEVLPLLALYEGDAELRKAVTEAVTFIGRLTPDSSREAYRGYIRKAFGLDLPDEEKADDAALVDRLREIHGAALARFLGTV